MNHTGAKYVYRLLFCGRMRQYIVFCCYLTLSIRADRFGKNFFSQIFISHGICSRLYRTEKHEFCNILAQEIIVYLLGQFRIHFKIRICFCFILCIMRLACQMNDCIHFRKTIIVHIIPRIGHYYSFFIRRNNVKSIKYMML